MKNFFKLFTVILLNLLLAVPTFAKTLEKKDIYFPVETEALMEGEIHYAFHLHSPRSLISRFPEVYDMDTIGLLQENDVMMVLAKFVYVVGRPVGFFDHEHFKNVAYVDHLMGEQEVKKIDTDTFEVTVPGESSHTYKIKTYFDSDELSTLPNSRIIQAVSAAKKLDVITQSASSLTFNELTNFSEYAEGGVSVTSYVPLKENRTLIIDYRLMAVKGRYAVDTKLEASLVREVEAVKKLIESWKAK